MSSQHSEWKPVFPPDREPPHWVALVGRGDTVEVLSDQPLTTNGRAWLAAWMRLNVDGSADNEASYVYFALGDNWDAGEPVGRRTLWGVRGVGSGEDLGAPDGAVASTKGAILTVAAQQLGESGLWAEDRSALHLENDRLVADVADLSPTFAELLRDHLRDWGEILSHLYFADLYRWAEKAAAARPEVADLRILLNYLEGVYASRPLAQEMIVVSFLEYVDAGSTLDTRLGPLLAAAAQTYREFVPALASSPKLSAVLPGEWRVVATNFPMWLTGDRLHPKFAYVLLQDEPLTFSDTVSYLNAQGVEKRIVGIDRARGGGFRWRGRGMLKLFASDWEVAGAGEDGDVFAIRFEKTLATSAGVDVVLREGSLIDGIRDQLAVNPRWLGLTAVEVTSLTWL